MSAILHQAVLSSYPAAGGGATDPFFNDVSLLLKFEGVNGSTNFVDSSPRPKIPTVQGNAQISTAQSRFGISSGFFDGNGDNLLFASSPDFGFGTGDFCFELFIRISDELPRFFFTFDLIAPQSQWLWGSFTSDRRIMLAFAVATRPASPQIPLNTWVHLAICRGSGTTRSFLNGMQWDSFADLVNRGASRDINIGGAPGISNNWHNGFIDEVRITKGRARYTTNFTPPTEPFPAS